MSSEQDLLERAELEVARIRDLLGVRESDPDAEVLATVLNGIEDLSGIAEFNASDGTHGLDEPPAPGPGGLDMPDMAGDLTTSGRSAWTAVVLVATFLVVAIVVFQLAVRPQPAEAFPPGLQYSEADPSDVLDGDAPDAGRVLSDLASAARAHPPAGEGDVHVVEYVGWSADPDLGTTLVRQWLRPDGSGRLTSADLPPLGRDGRLTETEATEFRTVPLPTGHIPTAQLDDLPRTPSGFAQALRDPACGRESADPDAAEAACLLDSLGAWSRSFALGPELAGTVWEALALYPQIRYLGTTTDRIGRDVHAVAAPHVEEEYVLVLLADPDTGRIVGEEVVHLPQEGFDPTRASVLGFSTILDAGLVASIGEMP